MQSCHQVRTGLETWTYSHRLGRAVPATDASPTCAERVGDLPRPDASEHHSLIAAGSTVGELCAAMSGINHFSSSHTAVPCLIRIVRDRIEVGVDGAALALMRRSALAVCVQLHRVGRRPHPVRIHRRTWQSSLTSTCGRPLSKRAIMRLPLSLCRSLPGPPPPQLAYDVSRSRRRS